MNTLIAAKNIDIIQEDHLILSEVDFTVEKGEWVYLLGKTGSGKSSLLKAIYADIPFEKGTLTVCNMDLKTLKKKKNHLLRRKIGIVFQDFQLLPDENVEGNLAFVLKATDWKDKKKIDQRIDELLLLVGMQNKRFKKIHELSGGEKQRIAIARALLNDPQLILADEPTGNLDPNTSMEIMKLLKEIQEKGQAVVMVTHDYNIVKAYPSKMYQCIQGKIQEIDQIPS
ncbi:MAG: ATP-binding cassette domain-containing protein [Flavobacteriales bacterium]|jgi:cell division transport system ATP-binding protein|nr:ATP-binding cassette domain-containing protein [Flavobacteriales bacterium]